MKRTIRTAAKKAAVLFSALILTLGLAASHAGAYSLSWAEKTLYDNYYILVDTEGNAYNGGYMFADVVSFYKIVEASFAQWGAQCGVDLTSGAVFPDTEWCQVMRGEKKVSGVDRVPNYPAFIELWQSFCNEGLTSSVSPETCLEMQKRLKAFFADASKGMITDTYTKRTSYIRLTNPTNLIPSVYNPADGSVAYCTQINYSAPASGAVSETLVTGDLKAELGLTDAQCSKLINVLKRGYPVNAGIESTPYAAYPADALRQGTQYAVWLILAGTTGNTGTGHINTGGPLTRSDLHAVTDRNINASSGTLDVLSYVDYLLGNAAEEPKCEVTVTIGEFTKSAAVEPEGKEQEEPADRASDSGKLDGTDDGTDNRADNRADNRTDNGRFTTQITVSAKNAGAGVTVTLEGLPRGSAVDGKAVSEGNGTLTLSLSGFNGATDRTRTLELSIPAEGNEEKEITVTARAWSGAEEEQVSLWFQSVGGTTQRMAVIGKSLEVTAAGDEATASVITPEKETEPETTEPETTEETTEPETTEETTEPETTEETTEPETTEETTEPETTEETTAPETSEETTEPETAEETTAPETTEPESGTPESTEETPQETEEEPETTPGTTSVETTMPETQESPTVLGAAKTKTPVQSQSKVLGASKGLLSVLLPVILLVSSAGLLSVILFLRRKEGEKGSLRIDENSDR